MLEDKLRDEIMETQKSQNDLTKWKLILVAGIGAAAFKVFPGNNTQKEPLLLALVPLVCMFVDTVCFHLGIRILSIARFFRGYETPDDSISSAAREYEEYCRNNRRGFALEGITLLSVTLLLSTIVFVVGVSPRVEETIGLCAAKGCQRYLSLMVSGGAGFFLSIAFFLAYLRKTKWLDEAPLGQTWPAYGAVAMWGKDRKVHGLRKVLHARVPDWVKECDRPDVGTIVIAGIPDDLIGLAMQYAELKGKKIVTAPSGTMLSSGEVRTTPTG